MAAIYKTQYGEVNITDDVLATISGLAATECYGLEEWQARMPKDGLVGAS